MDERICWSCGVRPAVEEGGCCVDCLAKAGDEEPEALASSMLRSLHRLRNREVSEAVEIIGGLLDGSRAAWAKAREWVEHRPSTEPDLSEREPIAEVMLVKAPADGWQVSKANPADFPTLTFARALVYPLEEASSDEAR